MNASSVRESVIQGVKTGTPPEKKQQTVLDKTKEG